MRDAIPTIPIPIERGKPEPMLNLNGVLHHLYDRAGPDLLVDYRRAPEPPVADEDARWVAQLVQELKS